MLQEILFHSFKSKLIRYSLAVKLTKHRKYVFNPRLPDVFFVTRPPKGGGKVVATPPWNFRTERLIPLYLLPVYRYGPLLSIDTKMGTIDKVSAPSEIWMH